MRHRHRSFHFAHGVASGDPLTDRVLIWTRISGTTQDDVPVHWVVSEDPNLRDVVRSGTATTGPDQDWTVHVDVDGLAPPRRTTTASVSLGGRSPVGRTRTLPGPRRSAPCASPWSRARSSTPGSSTPTPASPSATTSTSSSTSATTSTRRRTLRPRARRRAPTSAGRSSRCTSAVTLDDYRTRYAQYRSDPTCRRCTSAPVIATLDDHELADGAWAVGPTEHRARA